MAIFVKLYIESHVMVSYESLETQSHRRPWRGSPYGSLVRSDHSIVRTNDRFLVWHNTCSSVCNKKDYIAYTGTILCTWSFVKEK